MTNVFILYLKLATEQCIPSKVWKKIVLIFYKHCINTGKDSKKESSFSHSFLAIFFFISNATNFFIHSLNRFVLKKNAYGLLVFFNWVPYMQLSHMISGVNITDKKVIVASVNRPGRPGGVLRPKQGTSRAPKKIFRL